MSWIAGTHNSFAKPKGADQPLTIEGGQVTVSFPDTPLNVNVVNGPINVTVDNKLTIAPDSFEPIFELFEGMVVAYDACAYYDNAQGSLFVYADGSMKFVGLDGSQNTNIDLSKLKSACCKAKPIDYCETKYEGVDGFIFVMDDYTFNFVPKANPGNILMNIPPIGIKCNCETDPCCCYKQGVFKLVHNQQVKTGVTFPAGAYRIVLRNDDPTPTSKIFINNVPYLFNDAINLHQQVNEVTNVQDFVPQIVITNPDGLTYEYQAYYPSDFGGNLTGL